jgi:hypothetical protein
MKGLPLVFCLLLLAEAEEVLDGPHCVLVEDGLVKLVEHGRESLILPEECQILVASDLHALRV